MPILIVITISNANIVDYESRTTHAISITIPRIGISFNTHIYKYNNYIIVIKIGKYLYLNYFYIIIII